MLFIAIIVNHSKYFFTRKCLYVACYIIVQVIDIY